MICQSVLISIFVLAEPSREEQGVTRYGTPKFGEIFQHSWPLLGTANLNILQIWSIYISNGWKISAGPELNNKNMI